MNTIFGNHSIKSPMNKKKSCLLDIIYYARVNYCSGHYFLLLEMILFSTWVMATS